MRSDPLEAVGHHGKQRGVACDVKPDQPAKITGMFAADLADVLPYLAKRYDRLARNLFQDRHARFQRMFVSHDPSNPSIWVLLAREQICKNATTEAKP